MQVSADDCGMMQIIEDEYRCMQNEEVIHSCHIVPQLSKGIWWSSDSVMYFLGSSGAKDQLPGH